MKKSFTLLCILALSFSSLSATDYAPMGDLPGSPSQSSTVPLYTGSSTYASIVQQLYYASELTAAGASAGDINALKFYFGNKTTTVREVTRNLEIYIKLVSTSFTEFEVGYTNTDKYTYKFTDPGSSANKVFDGNYTIPATANNGDIIERTINTSRFYWDGTSNILITVIDKTNKKFYSLSGEDYSDSNLKSYGVAPAVTASRFVHMYWIEENSSEFTTYKNSLNGKFGVCSRNSTVESTERGAHSYVNYIKFSIVPPIPVPTSPSAGSITTSSAVLGWTAASGADSYEVRYGTTSGSLGAATNVGNVISYTLSTLDEETTYYYQIRTKIGSEYSAWTDESSFTTLAEAAHIHDGITFSKWASTTSMPTSGNYYLANDVALDPYNPSTITLTGNLNLCLNGNTANLYGTKIVVPEDKTLTIYDNIGGGKITGYVASEVGAADIYAKALIAVYSGGTLILKEGTIENAYVPDNDGRSYAIYSNGTIHLSGDVLINSGNADIYLYNSNIITLDGAISNAEKHTVWKNDGAFTSGWSTYMSGADPRDYFESANSARSVCFNGSEAALRLNLNLSESSNNSAIATYAGELIDVNLTRSLTSAQYNTFCLPFALTNAELQSAFGAGYDLQEFVSSSLVDETLELTFNKVTALVAGKPYLLKPSVNVANPIFSDVTITATSPVDQTSDTYISFYGIYSPTELEGGNKNILFLGAENELFWPEATENLNGFRAYFRVKGGAAKVAKRARIINKEEAPTSLNEVQGNNLQRTKYIENGQLFILYNGAKYNVQGQVIK